MNNVSCIAWRIPCPGFRSWSLLPPNQSLFRPACRELRTSPWRPFSIYSRSFTSQTTPSLAQLYPTAYRQRLSPFSFSVRSFKAARGSPNEPSVEHGLQLRSEPFSAREIRAIFGRGDISLDMGNRALAVLQGRRVAGTLDLDLPADIKRSVHPPNLENALTWLRENHPLDEDAAIIARIEREEHEEQERLVRRAEQLGLYKPQSGSYEAELGENNDISGKSILKQIRKKNVAQRKVDEERQHREWLEGEAQDREKLKRQIERSTALQMAPESGLTEARPRADPRQRPALAWIQKHHLRATNLDIDLSSMTTSRRLLPSLAVAILTIGLCYAFAQNYQFPAKEERMWPDTPPAAATVFALIGINVGIFALWKFPPAWRMLNRYFISAPLYPYALSMIGTVFSHQMAKHTLVNTGILFFLGTKIHDEIGRGDFLAVYMASGVFASVTSLTAHVLAGNLHYTSLGASGAICGILAAWMVMHSNDKFTCWLLPEEWEETVSARGWAVLAAFVGFEIFNILSPWRLASLDHWAHLGGYIAGAVSGLLLKAEAEKDRRKRRSWLEKFLQGE